MICSLLETEEMMGYTREIKEFFGRGPRFNLVLIKSGQKVNKEELSRELDCEIVDIRELVEKGRLEIEKVDGYTDLLEFLKEISNEAPRECVLIDIDFLLSCLNKEKRKYFFVSILQKTFPKPIILITSVFKDEVPDVSYQEFNYAKVIEWSGSHGK